ncbi:MAG: ribbon-helix-helix protein, CopG family [Pyrinomonadaceae bacterium]|nr:ribbon-helix-helix protein, CopG family [Pyrinomonadaceae bacterium]
MEQTTIAVRLKPEQLQKLDAIVQMTGWNQSEVIRRLIDSASVTPPSVTTDFSKKGEPLVVTHLQPGH